MRLLRPFSEKCVRESGVTLVELMVYIVIAGIVMASVYQLLIVQTRSYTTQREVMDVRESLRGAATLLAWELRQVSASGGDLYDNPLQPNSIALRSVQGTGVVCVEHATLPRFGLWATNGDITATAIDSALIFGAGAPGTGDDSWKVMEIEQVGTAAALGLGNCVWPGGGVPDLGVELVVANVPSDTAPLAVGAPFRAYRKVEYGIYQDAGRWWLGRRVGGAVTWEKLTGPLTAGGLVLTYYDATGAPTVDPTQVASVQFVIRGESFAQARSGTGTVQYQRDTLATKVTLRG